MTLSKTLVLLALGGSIAALVSHRERVFPIVALIASGIQTLMMFGVLQMRIKLLPLTLVLAGMLLVAGAVIWARSVGKTVTTGATVVTLAGLVQVLTALKVLS